MAKKTTPRKPMPDEPETRYEVSIRYEITKIEGGKRTLIFEQPMRYPDMSYVGMVAIEQVALRFQSELGALGVARVIAMGDGPKLKALGIPLAQ